MTLNYKKLIQDYLLQASIENRQESAENLLKTLLEQLEIREGVSTAKRFARYINLVE